MLQCSKDPQNSHLACSVMSLKMQYTRSDIVAFDGRNEVADTIFATSPFGFSLSLRIAVEFNFPSFRRKSEFICFFRSSTSIY